MKRVFQHPEEPLTGKKYWRSLGQLEDSPEFRGWLEREFPAGAAELQGGEVTRRNFLKLMGASTALAGLGLSACRRPEKHLVPFTRGVEWAIPGKALFFATSMPTRRGAQPLLVATYDGRPTKIEGNPLHPVSGGATDTWSQTSVLDLYDPDRSRFFWHRPRGAEPKKMQQADFTAALGELLKNAGDGAGMAFLTEQDQSPTRERLRAEVEKKFPKATWCVYEPLGAESAGGAFGEGVIPTPNIAQADVIMALDCDFLGTDGFLHESRQFSARRKPEGPDAKMNRLYVAENRYTITGAMADHRMRVPVSQIGAFAAALAQAIGAAGGDANLSTLAGELPQSAAKLMPEWINEAAADLVAAKGKSLVLVGPRQPAAVQALVASINSSLGSLGSTLSARRSSDRSGVPITELAKAIADRAVKTLFILGGNPVYNAPADLNWAQLQSQVENVVRLGFHEDETSELSTWHVPLAHYLESWGDGRATDGSYTAVQPMILPLYGSWSEIDLLAVLAGRPKPTGPELVQETFRETLKPADFVAAWTKFLHDGFQAESATTPEPLSLDGAAATASTREGLKAQPFNENTFEVVLVGDVKVDDGRYANNGWLQELPDPITKLTWDNAAQISPASAKKLGVKTGDVVTISANGRTLEIAVLVAPGHADNSLTIQLGYGRKFAGRIGGNGVGTNAYLLRTTAHPYFITGAEVKKAGRRYPLAVTQEHGSMEGRGADLVREATLEDYKKEPDYVKRIGIDSHSKFDANKQVISTSLYSNPPLDDIHQWGMVIDLSTCTGCSACMVACQAENNIPIVGKEQVINGREMHWIRTDRYFASDTQGEDEPEMVSQPMLCQHCENAPCETVCPVNATVHSEDGLNVMAYNRCIGTRYCANNCPFKVRRFNFFDYNQRKIQDGGLYDWNLISEKGMPDTLKMQKNPNVTVRMRGVMEKCTFCVQRIQEAKIAAKVHARDSGNVQIPADSFKVACQQACPNDAIVFGDIANKESRVSQLRLAERGYRLLEYLNVDTRMWYLARIRNPNPKMPDAAKLGGYSKPEKHHGHGHGQPSHENAHDQHGADEAAEAAAVHAGGEA